MQGTHADALLLLGRWDEGADICAELLAIPGVSPSNQLYPLRILGTIRGRRGSCIRVTQTACVLFDQGECGSVRLRNAPGESAGHRERKRGFSDPGTFHENLLL